MPPKNRPFIKSATIVSFKKCAKFTAIGGILGALSNNWSYICFGMLGGAVVSFIPSTSLLVFIYGPKAVSLKSVIKQAFEQWSDEILRWKSFIKKHVIYSFIIVNFGLVVVDYMLTAIIISKSIVFSELMPAFFTNICCPDLLDSAVFELIGVKNRTTEEYIKEVAEVANEQYAKGVLMTHSYNFISNQFLLVCKLLKYCDISSLLVLQFRIQVLPFIAPFLDILGFFDNTPQPQYLDFGYSEFVIGGMINIYKIFKAGDTAGMSEDSIKHTAAFLDTLIRELTEMFISPLNIPLSAYLLQFSAIDQRPDLYDANLFGETVSTYLEIGLFVRAVRILLLIYLLKFVVGRLKARVSMTSIIAGIIKIVFVWAGLYLSCIVIYSFPDNTPFMFHFVSFSWFRNLERLVEPALFYEFHYLCGLSTSCSLLDIISICRTYYVHYLEGEEYELLMLNLDALLIELFTVFISLLSYFTIIDWAWLTVMLIYMLPTFILLPSWVFLVASPDTGLNYTAYMWEGLFFWMTCTAHMSRQWVIDGTFYTGNDFLTEAKLSAIGWLLYLIGQFEHILVY